MAKPSQGKQKSANSRDSVDMVVIGGAGHVGLPLAITFANKGLRVVVYDINEEFLDIIAAGKMPALERGAEPILKEVLAKGRLTLSSDVAVVGDAATVVITIGTPVDEFLNPVHREIKKCINGLLAHLNDEQFLVLRSTVFPGTTEWLSNYLAEAGKSPRLAFCPERVVQGYAIREIQSMPQIISATTPEALAAAGELFALVAPETIELETKEAEFAKLFNNSYRYIQFSITNQFFMIANDAGVNYSRILDAMTRNYPRAQDMPTAGLTAGPCLFKDTMQLAAFSRNQFGLGHAAMLVNEGLVLHMSERLRDKFPLAEMTVGLLGMAFKADSDDIRASLSYKIKKDLAIHAKRILTTDPLVTTDPELKSIDEVIGESDLLILCVPHGAYKDLDTKGKPVCDIWNFLDGDTINLY